MTGPEATVLVERTLAMFANATGDHGVILHRHFLPRTVQHVEEAVHRYAERNKFLDPMNLLDVLAAIDGTETRPPTPALPSPYDVDRKNRRRMYADWEKLAEVEWRQIDAFIAGLADQDLADLKADILPSLREAVRRSVERKSVRESKLLKICVFRSLNPLNLLSQTPR